MKVTNNAGETVLHLAARKGHDEILKDLLESANGKRIIKKNNLQ